MLDEAPSPIPMPPSDISWGTPKGLLPPPPPPPPRIPHLPQNTQEMMLKVFDGNKMLKGARNWCLVQERHLVPGSAANDGALLFQVSGHSGHWTPTVSASSSPSPSPSLSLLSLPHHCLLGPCLTTAAARGEVGESGTAARRGGHHGARTGRRGGCFLRQQTQAGEWSGREDGWGRGGGGSSLLAF